MGRDKAAVINFIFVFLLPQLRANTIIQSRKVASFACPSMPGGPLGEEGIKSLMSYGESCRNTEGQIETHRDGDMPALAAPLRGVTPRGLSIDSPSAIAFCVPV